MTTEGYIDLTDGNKYYYYLKDHQGNNRVVINSSGTVAETNHYYPFGGVFSTSSSVQPYKYNGKEYDSKNGLNWYDYGARHYDATLGRWFVVDPLAEKHYSTSPYGYCLNNPVNMIDPDGKDGIYIAYPDYKINVAGLKIPNLGHAGVLLIDNKTGNTKYYEYGRYDKENIGIVRSLSIPNVEIDKQGKPTVESLNNVLSVLSEKAGQGGSIEGAYIKSDKFVEMNQYAKSKMSENYNLNRKKYSLINNNCATFALDVLEQENKVKDSTSNIWIKSPNNIVNELQETFTRITFVKEKEEK